MPSRPAYEGDEPEDRGDDLSFDAGGGGAATSDSREFLAFAPITAVPMAVFIVAQDPLYRRIFARALAAAGYEVRTYAAASEFLGEIGPDRAGCLLFDADYLPAKGPGPGGSDGKRDVSPPELLMRLAYSRSPLSAVGVAAPGTPLAGAVGLLHIGACEILDKPVKREALVSAVASALAGSQARLSRRVAAGRLGQLCPRQLALVKRAAGGQRPWATALRLFVGPRGLRRLELEVVSILGVSCFAEAVEAFRQAEEDAAFTASRRGRHGMK